MISVIPSAAESVWSEGYGDTHFLYHQLLRFVSASGIKLWISLLTSVCLFSYLIYAKGKNIREILFYSGLFLFGSYVFTGRLLFGKGLLVFLPLFIAYLIVWDRKNKLAVLSLAWILVWTYPLSPLLLLYSFVSNSFSFMENYRIRKNTNLFSMLGFLKEYSLFYHALIGFCSGLFIHPSFPNQFHAFYLEWWGQIFPPNDVEKIAEWLAPGNLLFFQTFFVLILISIFMKKDGDRALLVLFAIGFVSSYFTTKSIEWTVPIGLLWLGSSASLKEKIQDDKFAIVFGCLFFFYAGHLAQGADYQIKKNREENDLTSVSLACEKLETGTRLWVRWDDFPSFYFKCPKLIYPFGLNPIYSFAKNPTRYQMIFSFWKNEGDDLSELPYYLGYEYVIIDSKKHGSFLLSMMQNQPNWKIIHSLNTFFLFKREKTNATIHPEKTKTKPMNLEIPKPWGR
ncbi:hypothetical protein EHS11_00980 [Leptospira ilyithenensis]|uniref:Uncharacterized protein n=1 Tax=Leptospira ilyithenensis TaxID=2484901 RepID=A0A4R9LUK8_9LEPT|nr:hypothetical protein EHS11_00980 [Leptospira ilyithenensis]